MIVDCQGNCHTRRAFIQNANKYFKYEWQKRRHRGTLQAFEQFEEAASVVSWIESLDRYGVDKILLHTAPFASGWEPSAMKVSAAPPADCSVRGGPA